MNSHFCSTLRITLFVACLLNGLGAVEVHSTNSVVYAQSTSKIADYKSRNFLIHTDLAKEDADELLQKMETMLRIISKYWGTRNKKTIECHVVDKPENWAGVNLSKQAMQQTFGGGGVTLSQTIVYGRRSDTKSIVFASARRGTPLHEAVHAFCYLNFGTTGPTWYAEGMAEMGNFWVEGDSTVTAPAYLIRYLTRSEPKSLKDITDGTDKTGDGWQNYAWRWALCHLLANNPNYADRFRVLGLQLLSKRKATSFSRTFGGMSKELEFEYRFFLKHLQPGLDVGKCAWDWKTKFKSPKGSGSLVSKIDARRGWQASRLKVKEGNVYSYKAEGKWRLDMGADFLTADGTDDDAACLVATIMADGELKPAIKLGSEGEFTATHSGQLYLRCNSPWNSLGDNDGKVTVTLTNAE